jgi:hypothetical protein
VIPVDAYSRIPPRLVAAFKPRDDGRKAAERRGFAIHAYTGSNGGGKSLAMVHDSRWSLSHGRTVLSTVRLLDFDDPRPCPGEDGCDDPLGHLRPDGTVHQASHPNYVALRNFAQLLDFERGDVLLDEVTGIASSRESHSLPAPIVNLLMQLRRRDVLLRWTAPNWARADKVIREVTQAVTYCAGMMPVTSVLDDGQRLWRDRQLFRWETFDAFEFDEFTSSKREKCVPLVGQWFWRPGSITQGCYDTYNPVTALQHIDLAGRCVHCGKKVRVEYCNGDHAPEPVPAPRRLAVSA